LRDLCYIGDSFGTGIIARKPDADEVAVTVEVHVDAVANGVDFGMGNLVNPLQDCLSPMARSLFQSVFHSLQIGRWTTINDFLNTENGTHRVSGSPHSLIFLAVPAVNKKPSLVNRMGVPEFDHNNKVFPNFWPGQTEYRSPKNGDLTTWIDIAIQLPTVFMTPAQRLEHFNASNTFKTIGPSIGDNYYLMTLYGGYAAAFRAFNTCQMTLHARARGFRPLFAITNASEHCCSY
jgi:hypothetical protein